MIYSREKYFGGFLCRKKPTIYRYLFTQTLNFAFFTQPIRYGDAFSVRLESQRSGILYVSFVEVYGSAPDPWNTKGSVAPAESPICHFQQKTIFKHDLFGWSVLAKWDILMGDVYFII